MVKKHVGFVKEKDHLWFFTVTDFRERLKKFRDHPKHKSSIHDRALDQSLAVEDGNRTFAITVRTQPIPDVKGWLSKEKISAFSLQCNNGTDDGCQTLF